MTQYVVSNRPEITVVGIACRTSNAPDAGPRDIPKLWGRFYEENIATKIPHKIGNEIMALYCDYEGDYTKPYTCIIGCPVSKRDIIPEGMVIKTIPAGSFAIFHATGEQPLALIETWQSIWNRHDLKRSYKVDAEIYGEKFFKGSPQEIEVVIGVELKTV